MANAPFRLNRSGFLLAVVSAAFAGEAGAAAGRAEFTIGGVTVARNGAERPLARGTELDNGDTVRTNDGRAQIRFTDGAYVSLQPNTEYSIKDYRYGAGTQGEERGFFSLLKGAMRTVTGAIGRINRDRYQIATPTATVGIRGTGGVIQVQDDGSTLVIGTSGIWSLTNPSGSVDVPGGTSAVAPSDPKQPPQETTQQPTSGPAPVPEQEPVFVAGEERTEEGLPVIPQPAFTPLVTGDNYAALLIYGTGGSIGIDGGEGPFSAVFNAAGQLTEIDVFNFTPYSLEGTHADFGSDGVLAWGRWIGDVTLGCGECGTVNYNGNQGLHYVVGVPTPDMPVSGTATYSLLGATQPTYTTGATAPGTFSGSLAVNFGTSTVGVNFNVQMPDRTYTIGGDAFISGPNFFGSLFSGLTLGGCSCICDARVDGFFSGASAARAGAIYHISDIDLGKNVIGAAAFKKD